MNDYKLVLLTRAGTYTDTNKHYRESYGLFLCLYCGKEVIRRLRYRGKQYSCGCSGNDLKTLHGETGTSLYTTWRSMKLRCECRTTNKYSRYGGRGIKVCSKWIDSYIAFRDWARTNGYTPELQLDRIDNDGNYCPDNCRFISQKQNSRRSPNVKLCMEDAMVIRYLDNMRTKRSVLASIFSVSESMIGLIITGKAWS